MLSEGRFSETPIPDGVRSVRIYRGGSAGPELGLSLATQLLPEEIFRERYAGLIRAETEALIAHAKKKKLAFDGDAMFEIVNGVLQEYLSTELPLPATQAELVLAHRWLGVPREP